MRFATQLCDREGQPLPGDWNRSEARIDLDALIDDFGLERHGDKLQVQRSGTAKLSCAPITIGQDPGVDRFHTVRFTDEDGVSFLTTMVDAPITFEPEWEIEPVLTTTVTRGEMCDFRDSPFIRYLFDRLPDAAEPTSARTEALWSAMRRVSHG